MQQQERVKRPKHQGCTCGGRQMQAESSQLIRFRMWVVDIAWVLICRNVQQWASTIRASSTLVQGHIIVATCMLGHRSARPQLRDSKLLAGLSNLAQW